MADTSMFGLDHGTETQESFAAQRGPTRPREPSRASSGTPAAKKRRCMTRATGDAPDAATRRKHRISWPKRAASIRAKYAEPDAAERNAKTARANGRRRCVGARCCEASWAKEASGRAEERPKRDKPAGMAAPATRSVAGER